MNKKNIIEEWEEEFDSEIFPEKPHGDTRDGREWHRAVVRAFLTTKIAEAYANGRADEAIDHDKVLDRVAADAEKRGAEAERERLKEVINGVRTRVEIDEMTIHKMKR